eukprot:11229495-Alexandrium_andersonii.AAC.1
MLGAVRQFWTNSGFANKQPKLHPMTNEHLDVTKQRPKLLESIFGQAKTVPGVFVAPFSLYH